MNGSIEDCLRSPICQENIALCTRREYSPIMIGDKEVSKMDVCTISVHLIEWEGQQIQFFGNNKFRRKQKNTFKIAEYYYIVSKC
jgi:hypothetical protein